MKFLSIPKVSPARGTTSLSFTALLFALLVSVSTSAATPPNVKAIQRETKIMEDVMHAALRQELRHNVRVTRLDAEYLAPQGVLISLSLNSPWLKYGHDGEPSFEFHGNISLPEIPAMVTNILEDLQINIAPYEPETLEELRDLRDEQRELRMDARKQRTKLRSHRRALVREDDDGDRRELEREIRALEQELQLVEQQYDSLSQEIEQQYQSLRNVPEPPAVPRPASAKEPQQVNIEALLAQAVCDYGATLKSLDDDQYITVAVRRGSESQYMSFQMQDVERCSRGDLKLEDFLEDAYQYAG